MNKNIGFLLLALCSASALNGMDSDSLIHTFDSTLREQAEEQAEEMVGKGLANWRENITREATAPQVTIKAMQLPEQTRVHPQARAGASLKKVLTSAALFGGMGALAGYYAKDRHGAQFDRAGIICPAAVVIGTVGAKAAGELASRGIGYVLPHKWQLSWSSFCDDIPSFLKWIYSAGLGGSATLAGLAYSSKFHNRWVPTAMWGTLGALAGASFTFTFPPDEYYSTHPSDE